MALKETIKEHIIEQEKKEIASLQAMYHTYHSAADLDEESTLETDDYSHQSQNFTAADNMEKRLERAKYLLNQFLNLEHGKKDTVELGALIVTDMLSFYIGISSALFNLDGKAYIGLDTEAPIYKEMESKKVGDSFSFNGKKYVINEIF